MIIPKWKSRKMLKVFINTPMSRGEWVDLIYSTSLMRYVDGYFIEIYMKKVCDCWKIHKIFFYVNVKVVWVSCSEHVTLISVWGRHSCGFIFALVDLFSNFNTFSCDRCNVSVKVENSEMWKNLLHTTFFLASFYITVFSVEHGR